MEYYHGFFVKLLNPYTWGTVQNLETGLDWTRILIARVKIKIHVQITQPAGAEF